MTNLDQLGEFGLIHRLNERLAVRPGVRLGIGDDAALLDSLQAPVVTCDCLVEGVHFRRDWTSPRALGRKAIAVNVSDIAAMGASPVAAFITLALSEQDDVPFIEELYRGLEEAAAEYGLTIAGGDTSRSLSGLMLSVTVIGEAPASPVLRSGARPGDLVVVTGSLGDSAGGLALLQAEVAETAVLPIDARDYLLKRHHEPTARLREMAAFTPEVIAAGMDLSDGIAGDAAHIAQRSGVTIEIDVASLPITSQCREAANVLGRDAIAWALTGGEDYELLWCVAPENVEVVVRTVMQATGTSVTVVGRCIEKTNAPVILVSPDGRRTVAAGAFTHF